MINTKKVIIIVLAVTAIILGVLIYKQKVPKVEISASLNSNDQGARVSLPSFIKADGTPDLQKAKLYLSAISGSSSDEEKARHYEYAVSIAKPSEYLNVTSCENVEPLVLQVVEGVAIHLKNESDADVHVSINSKPPSIVKAQSTTLLNASFSDGPGLYGYGCQSSGIEGRGMILVTPKS